MWYSPSFKKCVAALMTLTSSLAIAGEDCVDNDPRPECKDPPITVTDVPPTGTTGYGNTDPGISIHLEYGDMQVIQYRDGVFYWVDFYSWTGDPDYLIDGLNYLNNHYNGTCEIFGVTTKIRCWYP